MKGLTHGNYTSRTGKAKVAVSRGSASHTSTVVATSASTAELWELINQGEMGGIQVEKDGLSVGRRRELGV